MAVPKNCINCGAPLRGGKCDYCGTEYNGEGRISAKFDASDGTGIVSIFGKTYQCYVSKMEAEGISLNAGRDMSGRMIRENTIYKHKFTLIEI